MCLIQVVLKQQVVFAGYFETLIKFLLFLKFFYEITII
ncbi:putative membrane protein [Piscirickettsia salmonis LF-89 = ATCC VR-1361]|nr:putative membrane protein [Piscirickettsia salmonis LF-89 = ATCC VR-1361]